MEINERLSGGHVNEWMDGYRYRLVERTDI